jgi:hypothetical protein
MLPSERSVWLSNTERAGLFAETIERIPFHRTAYESVDPASKVFGLLTRQRGVVWRRALPSERRRGLESKSIDAAELFPERLHRLSEQRATLQRAQARPLLDRTASFISQQSYIASSSLNRLENAVNISVGALCVCCFIYHFVCATSLLVV